MDRILWYALLLKCKGTFVRRAHGGQLFILLSCLFWQNNQFALAVTLMRGIGPGVWLLPPPREPRLPRPNFLPHRFFDRFCVTRCGLAVPADCSCNGNLGQGHVR